MANVFVAALLFASSYSSHSSSLVHASPLQAQRQPVRASVASELVVTASSGGPPHVVTYTPSRVRDEALWTIRTPTTLPSAETVYPLGYEWVVSPSPAFALPAVPSNAPYPLPAGVTAALYLPAGADGPRHALRRAAKTPVGGKTRSSASPSTRKTTARTSSPTSRPTSVSTRSSPRPNAASPTTSLRQSRQSSVSLSRSTQTSARSSTSSATSRTVTSSARTTTLASSTSNTSSRGIVCSIGCAACKAGVKRDAEDARPTERPLSRRHLEDPKGPDFPTVDGYVWDQLTFNTNTYHREELPQARTGTTSTGMAQAFGTKPLRFFVSGLVGCTSVTIISEKGVWLSHFWESPSFEFPDKNDNFQKNVLGAIEKGDGPKMISPFTLAADDGILSPKNNVKIFISTPGDPATGTYLYKPLVNKIEALLIGESSPWKGVQPHWRAYPKPKDEAEEKLFEKRANGKVLVEYDNDQLDEASFESHEPQRAIYRVWQEQEMNEHFWAATADQKGK